MKIIAKLTFMPWLEAERYDGDEAECEPLPPLEHSGAVVAAVHAARCDVLIAFELGGEGVGSACEDERHGWLRVLTAAPLFDAASIGSCAYTAAEA